MVLASCSSTESYAPNWHAGDAPAPLLELNHRIAEFGDRLSTQSSPVVVVDQFDGFDAIVDTVDGVHPTPGGEDKLASKWAAELVPLLPAAGPPPRVVLLGDSITDNHVRAKLWKELKVQNRVFDFVGSQHSFPLSVDIVELFHGEEPFDTDHEGHTGWQTSELLEGSLWDLGDPGNLSVWLDDYVPDIAVIHIGTNDLIVAVSTPAEIAEDIESVIEELRRANPQVEVLVAQIIPYLPLPDSQD